MSENRSSDELAAAMAVFEPGRRGIRAIAAVAVLVVLGAGFLAWRARPTAQPVAVAAVVTSATGSSSRSASPAQIVISVSGRVRHPGLVTLPAGSRVADATVAAGGILPDTDVTGLNLARKLVDGELLLIGVLPSATVAGQAASAGVTGQARVNLNTADLSQLQTLPGIGPVLAQRILDYRTSHGQFQELSELRKVQGIGAARFEQLKELIEV